MTSVSLAPDRVRRAVRILFVVQFVSMGAMEMSGPFWPVHLASFDQPGWLFGVAGTAVYVGPMLGIALTSSFWGRVGDRFGHRLMMIRALLGLALTQLALAFAADVWSILALRFLQGACAGYIAPAQAYGVGIASPAVRTRLFAHLQVSTNVGSVVGAVAGGVILDHAAFFWINAAAAAICAACAGAVALLLPDVPAPLPVPVPETALPPDRPAAGFRLPAPVLALLGVMGLLLAARMITQAPFSLYVTSVLGAGTGVTGLCYAMLALGFAVSAPAWARHFEGMARSATLRRMTWVAAGCAGLTAIAGLTTSVTVFAAAYLGWGVLLGATTPVLMALLSRTTDGARQGRLLGVAQSTAQGASMAGIALGVGIGQTVGLEHTYLFVAAAYAAGAVALWAMASDRHR
ncbi:MFS transporter [Azospirillum sp.]|uniref:MFS transporter n=1 Tax=Azospirillum sp. TaxID=34012 RepID=UPI002D641EF6|nr:MFS transporter [Azospirillum sp.]HYF86714.1 MFS transporter [Azospirillum sp.]